MKTNLLTKYLLMVAPIIAAPIAIVACGKAPQASASDEKLHSNQKQETKEAKDASKNNDDAIDENNPLFNPDLSDDAPIVPIKPPQKEQEPEIDPTKPDPKILAKIAEYEKKMNEEIYPYIMRNFSEDKLNSIINDVNKNKEQKKNALRKLNDDFRQYIQMSGEFEMEKDVYASWSSKRLYHGLYDKEIAILKEKISAISKLGNKIFNTYWEY